MGPALPAKFRSRGKIQRIRPTIPVVDTIRRYWCGSHVAASAALKRLVGFSAKNRFYRANRDLGRIFKTELSDSVEILTKVLMFYPAEVV